MLLCSVIVGDFTQGKEKYDTPPRKGDGVTQYDSMVDNIENPSIFVICRDFHALPLFKITYRS